VVEEAGGGGVDREPELEEVLTGGFTAVSIISPVHFNPRMDGDITPFMATLLAQRESQAMGMSKRDPVVVRW